MEYLEDLGRVCEGGNYADVYTSCDAYEVQNSEYPGILNGHIFDRGGEYTGPGSLRSFYGDTPFILGFQYPSYGNLLLDLTDLDNKQAARLERELVIPCEKLKIMELLPSSGNSKLVTWIPPRRGFAAQAHIRVYANGDITRFNMGIAKIIKILHSAEENVAVINSSRTRAFIQLAEGY